METFFVYMIKSALTLTLLYVIYWFFMRRETFFTLNRLYLLSAILFSVFVPVFNFTISQPVTPSTYTVLLDAVSISANAVEKSYYQNLTLFQIIWIIYLTGVTIFSVRFIIQLIQLFSLIKRKGITNKDGMNLVFTDAGYSPFSFFNYIFVNNSIQTNDAENILAHELIHVKQLHTIDRIILEMFTIFQWFNPVVWLYRYSFKELHEYLADAGVMLKGYEKCAYQNLLLALTLGVNVTDLANNFNHSLIKKRIIMMSKSKSKKSTLLKIVAMLPIVALFIFAMSCNRNADVPKPSDNAKNVVQPKSEIVEQKEVFNIAEEMPVFPGGDNALRKFLFENVKYSENAKANKIQGKVYVRFVVTKTGAVSDATVIRSSGNADLDAEALRVINLIPTWKPALNGGKPVNVFYTIPVNFVLK